MAMLLQKKSGVTAGGVRGRNRVQVPRREFRAHPQGWQASECSLILRQSWQYDNRSAMMSAATRHTSDRRLEGHISSMRMASCAEKHKNVAHLAYNRLTQHIWRILLTTNIFFRLVALRGPQACDIATEGFCTSVRQQARGRKGAVQPLTARIVVCD